MTETLPYQYDDGGRAAAGFKRPTGDCVIRAIAIGTDRPYREVYDMVTEYAAKTAIVTLPETGCPRASC